MAVKKVLQQQHATSIASIDQDSLDALRKEPIAPSNPCASKKRARAPAKFDDPTRERPGHARLLLERVEMLLRAEVYHAF